MINIKMIPVGELEANCYFVVCGDEAIVIDPGAPSKKLDSLIEAFGAKRLKYILLTHGHFDHIGYTAALKKKYPHTKIVIGEKDNSFTANSTLNLSLFFGDECEPFTADITVSDGDTLHFGDEEIKVMSTPGHTQGSVCYIIGNNIFSGDTLFCGTTGRMDFPTGSETEMMQSIKRLSELHGNPDIYCGHNSPTTLEREKKNNYAMRQFK